MTRPASTGACSFRKYCDLKRMAATQATATPISREPTKMNTNFHSPHITPTNVMGLFSKLEMTWYSTIATASFMTDSPNTSAFKFLSAFSRPKTASTVTGSVAEMMAPNRVAWKKSMRKERCSTPSSHIITEMTTVEIAVPTNASMHIAPVFLKNLHTGPAVCQLAGAGNARGAALPAPGQNTHRLMATSALEKSQKGLLKNSKLGNHASTEGHG